MIAAASLAAVAGAGLVAAPLDGVRVASDGYAVRFILPVNRAAEPVAKPSAREAPLAILAEAVPVAGGEAVPVAVASAPPTLPAPTAARPTPRGKVPGVISLSYNIAGGANAADAIEVEKLVSIGKTDAGRIPLRIDGNAHVFALGSRLAEIIAAQSGEKAVPEGLERDFVSLERLRALGIAVRYDAIRDRLVVDPPA